MRKPDTIRVKLASNGKHWQATITMPNGERFGRGLGAKSKVSKRQAEWAAQALVAEFALTPQAALSTGNATLAQWRVVFTEQAQVADRTADNYDASWGRLEKHFGVDVKIRDITRVDAKAFETAINKLDLSLSTKRKYIMHAKVFFEAALDQDLVPFNPFGRLASSQPKLDKSIVYVDDAALERILSHCRSDQMRALFAIARWGGLRLNEIKALKWTDIDFEHHVLRVVNKGQVQTTKKRSRTVYIQPKLYALLTRWHAEADGKSTGPTWGLPACNLYRDVEAILARAGVEGYGKPFHNLRANCGQDWRTKVGPMEAAKLLGHSAAVAYEFYHDLKPEDVVKITGKIEKEVTA